jgi:hypothetical protein
MSYALELFNPRRFNGRKIMNRIYQGKVTAVETPADIAENKKGAAKAPVQELRLMASLLSSRQFEILTTAGFDLGKIKTISSLSVNYGLHT